MILYDLVCPDDHRFESWFRNSNVVEKLIKAGEVACPMCGSKKVHKAPMAPRIGKSRDNNAVTPAGEEGKLQVAMENATKALSELREVIEKNFEDVGGRFPDEARRIYYGETPSRGIYGDASQDEAEALMEEGIEISTVPWKRRKTS